MWTRTRLLIALAILAIGCQPVASQRLVGRWEGRPDSTADYLARQAFAAPRSATDRPAQSRGSTSPNTAASGTSSEQSVLEGLDIRLTMELRPDGSATMWRDDGQDRLAGTWRVLETQGRHTRLQLAVPRPTEEDSYEVRNFAIEFVAEGRGFTLIEEGADPQFGALLFRPID